MSTVSGEHSSSEYARAGLVGVLPPQANTTVEAELGVLLPPDVGMIVSRLVCNDPDSRARLVGYLSDVARALQAFDRARPDVVLFACTGSSYLAAAGSEHIDGEAADGEAAVFSGFGASIISAAGAVRAALDALDAQRIALVSPYPAWLTEACVEFWHRNGRRVVAVQSPAGDRSDTRRIYALRSADALAAVQSLNAPAAQAVVISGTGMPSRAAIARATMEQPLLCSNLCLAWAAVARLGGAALDRASLDPWLAPGAPWRDRLATHFPSLAATPR